MPPSSLASHRSATILDGSKVEFLDGFRDSFDDDENNIYLTNGGNGRRDETVAAMPLKWTRPYSFNKGKRVHRSTSSISTTYQATRTLSTNSFKPTTPNNLIVTPLRQQQQRLLCTSPSRPSTNMTHRPRSHLQFGSNRSGLENRLNNSTETSPPQQAHSPQRFADIQQEKTSDKAIFDEKLGWNGELIQTATDPQRSHAISQQSNHVVESVKVLKLQNEVQNSIPLYTKDDSFRTAAIRSVGKKDYDSPTKFIRRNGDVPECSSIDVVFSVGTHVSDDELLGPYRRSIGVRTNLNSQEYSRKQRSDSSQLNESSHSTGPRYIRSKSTGTNSPLPKSKSRFFTKSKNPLHMRAVSQDYSETDTNTTVSTEEEKGIRSPRKNINRRKNPPGSRKLEQAIMSCSSASKAYINAICEGTETTCFLDLESDDDDDDDDESDEEDEISCNDKNFPDDEGRGKHNRRKKKDTITSKQSRVDKNKIKSHSQRNISKSVPAKNSITDSTDSNTKNHISQPVTMSETVRTTSSSSKKKSVWKYNKINGRTNTHDSTYDSSSCRSLDLAIGDNAFNCSQFVTNFTQAMIDHCLPPDPIIGPKKFF
jgi:hypothetical protein